MRKREHEDIPSRRRSSTLHSGEIEIPKTPPANTSAHSMTPTLAGSQGNILLADDDVLITTPLSRLLSGNGYHVTCVDDGWKAVKLLEDNDFDLFITDIRMPGNDALDMLRGEPVRNRQLPVIVITGYPTVESAIDALRLCVVDYICKPFEPAALLGSVARAVARKRALRTVQELEVRVGEVTAILESVKSSLDNAGAPLSLAPSMPARADDGRPDDSLQARLHRNEFATLSRREREILSLMAQGHSAVGAAQSLGISVSTVRNHLKSAYRKIGVGSQLALVRKLLA
jgi:FixJ family two-component response regulator